MEIKDIPTRMVNAGDRLRPVNPTKVTELMKSFEREGQIVPIEVVGPNADGKFLLISGAHRLDACRRSGRETVSAVVVAAQMEENIRKLREIDENLYRSELSPYDYAVFIGIRSDVWAEINGAVKAGRPKVGDKSFTRDTAEKFGLSEDQIERARGRLKKGAKNPSAWAALRGTSIAETGAHLDAFLTLQKEKQEALLQVAARADFNFSDAYIQVRGARSAKAPKTVQQEVDALEALWDQTSQAGRVAFQKRLKEKAKATAANAKG